jgi:uncharacterized membrane protein
MKSKVSLVGYAIHPMLVSFPIAFYAASTVCFVVFQVVKDPFWFQVGYIAGIAGVATAVLAAIPGLIDLVYAIPKSSPAKATGVFHGLLHTLALALFGSIIYMYKDVWTNPEYLMTLSATSAVVISVVGIVCTLASGFLGWTLTQTYHLGVDLTPEQIRLEPFSVGRRPRASSLGARN